MLKILFFTLAVSFLGTAPLALATTIDTKATTLQWTGTKKMGDKHFGDIFLKNAEVQLTKKGDLKKATLVVDMNSLTVKELKGEWETKFLRHMKSADFFDVDKFPTATLVLEKQMGKNALSGKLTIKGKTQPVTIKYSKKGPTYTGTLKFDRTKFGVVYGSGNFFKELTADKIINNEVTVDFKVVTR